MQMRIPVEPQPPLIIQGKPVSASKYGNGPIPCLFMGPGELYFPSLPTELTKLFTFYSADRYFTYPKEGERVSAEEIQSLTLEKLLEHYEEARKQLGLEKMAVIGPSALGLVAHAYAEKYPAHTSHVVMLGTPSGIGDLAKRQTFFMEANYGPSRLEGKRVVNLSTPWAEDKWKRHQEGLARFAKQKQEGKLSDDESLIQELLATQEQYSIEPESEKTLRARWHGFNTIMRGHFFSSMIAGFEMGRTITVPTIVVSGSHDGIAPYHGLVDDIESKKIQGKISYVVLHAGHSPQTAEGFTEAIKAWLNWVAQNPDGSSNNEEWLDAPPLQEILTRHDRETAPHRDKEISPPLRAHL